MTKNNLNPKINEVDKDIIDEDLLSEFMLLDKKYTTGRKVSYLKYKQNYTQLFPNNSIENLFMSLKNSYLNIIHLITKNAIVATVICVVALTTVSASAAQLIAPNEYKPSTLASNIFTNKQKDTNPYTPLKPDESNNVAISDKCDLAVKYPKQIQNIPISIQKSNLDQNFTLFSEVAISDQNNAKYSTGAQNFFDVACNSDKSKFTGGELKNLQNMSKEELVQKTGWFITQAGLKDIQYEETLNGTDLVVFRYNNLNYQINFATPSDETKAKNWILFGNEIQLQFNSLVKNEANVEILKKPETIVNKPITIIDKPVVSKPEEKVVTKTLTLVGETDGYTILAENQMTYSEGNKFIAFYYTKLRSEFTSQKPAQGAVAEFKITAKIKSNPKIFELVDKVGAEFELVDVQKIEQTNTSSEVKSKNPAANPIPTTNLGTMNIQIFTTTNNPNECSQVKAKIVTIPKTQAVASETSKKLFTDQDSFFNGFNKYLKKVYSDADILYIELDKSVLNDPKWEVLGTSCGFGYHNEITQTLTQWDNINAAFFIIDGKVQTFQIEDQNADVFWTSRG